jgi:hypothetical protein
MGFRPASILRPPFCPVLDMSRRAHFQLKRRLSLSSGNSQPLSRGQGNVVYTFFCVAEVRELKEAEAEKERLSARTATDSRATDRSGYRE